MFGNSTRPLEAERSTSGWRAILALAASVGLLLLVYVPTFAVVRALRVPVVTAIPIVIAMSCLVAGAVIFAWSRFSHLRLADFGFRLVRQRYLAIALLCGLPFGFALALVDRLIGNPAAPPQFVLQRWESAVFLVVAASFQEEIIFRGLLQTAAHHIFPTDLRAFGVRVSWATILVALLFGALHFEVSPLTAFGAVLLGLLAGELRQRSGSIVPAIAVHVVFNAASWLVQPNA